MESSSSSSLQLKCCCGRTFLQTNAYSNHQKSCKKTKARLSSALFGARDTWQRLKRARTATVVEPPQPGLTNGLPLVQKSPTPAHPAILFSPELGTTENRSASVDPPDSIQTQNTNVGAPPVEAQDVPINEVCLLYAGQTSVHEIMPAPR